MARDTHHYVPAGNTITVTVSVDMAHVVDASDPSVKGVATVGSPVAFGPYAVPHTFRVQDDGANSSVVIAASDLTANIPSTAQAAMFDAIPAEDAEDGETVWNDVGTLKVSSPSAP